VDKNLTTEIYHYWLGNISKISSAKIDGLLSVFSTVKEIFECSRNELIHKTDLKEAEIDHLLASRNKDTIQKSYEALQKKGIVYLSKLDSSYPEKLKNICQAPFGLYQKGIMPKQGQKALAIVGARECTLYGREIAKYLAGAVAREGIDVISGLARGIDSYAHLGALHVGGNTIAILGCGIDICYPKENFNLFIEIQHKGCILSEFSPGTPPLASNFPMRNRMISGLSDGIVVIEAKEKSGSLITVDIGLEQGKEIYAVPGRMTDLTSSGCNNLIKMGAKLVATPQDILEDFVVNYRMPARDIPLLKSEEKSVYNTLSLDPKHITIIAQETNLPLSMLTEVLLNMEMNHWIHQTIKNYYVLGSHIDKKHL
jgi:DNA processing protein